MGLLSLFLHPFISLIGVNLILVSLLICDYSMTHNEIKLEVTREDEGKLSLDEKKKINFYIINKGSFQAAGRLIDELPKQYFEVNHREVDLCIQPGERTRIGYEVIPKKRGAFVFGKVHLKIESKLGLYNEYFTIPLEQEYKVYPNVQHLNKYRMSLYKNILEKEERKAVKLINQGTAFKGLQEYIRGDDYRRINWAASARSEKLITNQYEPEKNQRVYSLIDIGRPMSYTLRGMCKLDQAINTAIILSDIVMHNGDLSGLMCFNEKVIEQVSPGKGAAHRDKLMEALYHIQSTHATSSYEDAFIYFREKERRRSILFLFTDFDTYEEAEMIINAASIIERQHLIVIVLMKDIATERIAMQVAKTEEEVFRRGIALALLEERKQAIKKLNRSHIMCIEVEPEKLSMAVVTKYVEIKNRFGM